MYASDVPTTGVDLSEILEGQPQILGGNVVKTDKYMAIDDNNFPILGGAPGLPHPQNQLFCFRFDIDNVICQTYTHTHTCTPTYIIYIDIYRLHSCIHA